MTKTAVVELLNSQKLWSHKIWMTVKSWNFHTVKSFCLKSQKSVFESNPNPDEQNPTDFWTCDFTEKQFFLILKKWFFNNLPPLNANLMELLPFSVQCVFSVDFPLAIAQQIRVFCYIPQNLLQEIWYFHSLVFQIMILLKVVTMT